MKLWPFSAKPSPDARSYTPEIGGGKQIAAPMRIASALRRRPSPQYAGELSPKRGMWVRHQDATGILTNIESGDVATVMLVDKKEGTNVLEIHVPAAELRQAYFDEIPEKRRPDQDRAAKFGYTRARK